MIELTNWMCWHHSLHPGEGCAQIKLLFSDCLHEWQWNRAWDEQANSYSISSESGFILPCCCEVGPSSEVGLGAWMPAWSLESSLISFVSEEASRCCSGIWHWCFPGSFLCWFSSWTGRRTWRRPRACWRDHIFYSSWMPWVPPEGAGKTVLEGGRCWNILLSLMPLPNYPEYTEMYAGVALLCRV